jgi:flagellar basal body-associated protein FliL
MDTIPSSFTPSRNIFFYLVVFVFLLAVLGVIFWYADRGNRQDRLSIPSSSPTPFNSAIQVIPEGAESREVDQTLTVFGFPNPLPFFDKDNVVQSLDLDTQASDIQPYLSYRVFGQKMPAVHDAYTRYLEKMGGKQIKNASLTAQLLFFRMPNSRGLIRVSFAEDSQQQESVKSIVIDISLFPLQLPSPP